MTPGDVDDPSTWLLTHARRAVQEIVTCHVVLKDRDQCDELIREAVAEFGVDVPRFVAGFISTHAADDVQEAVAADRFYFVLGRVGSLLSLLAEVSGQDEAEVVFEFAARDWTNEDDDLGADAEAVDVAVRAAQTCLVANYFVRQGRKPWGIQHSLGLADMCVVVEVLGLMLIHLVSEFEETYWPALIHELLHDIRVILAAQAGFAGRSVSDQVAHYFMSLARADAAG